MHRRPRHAHNVFHRKIPHHQGIRDQRSMAPPRHRLSTHNRRRLPNRKLFQPPQPRKKILRLHVIRKPTKTGIVPTHIRRIRLRTPQSAKFFQMHIPNPRRAQMPRQSVSIKLWIVSRTWNAAHIHHALHPMRPQQLNKFRKRPRRMSDRENCRLQFFAPHAQFSILWPLGITTILLRLPALHRDNSPVGQPQANPPAAASASREP